MLCGETTVRDTAGGERLVESCLRRTLDVLAQRGVETVEMDGHVSDPHWFPAWIRLDPTGRWFRLVEIETSGDARAALGAAVEPDAWQRIASTPQLREQLAQVAEITEHARTSPIPELPEELYGEFERTGDRAAFESRYFERRRALTALAITALLEPDGDTDALADLITAICDEPYWAVPAHVARDGLDPRQTLDLFASETGSALAEIAALLGERLPAELVRRVRTEVIARVIEPYEQHTYWWEDSPTNWAAVCAGSVALAAIQVCKPERVRALLPRLRASLRRSLDGYGDDGVCVEGFGYWRYGFGYYLVAVEAIDAVLGPDPEGEPARAAEAARWPLRAFLSGRTLVTFADTWLEGTADAGLLAGADRRYGNVGVSAPELTDPEIVDECGRWALALRSLCWAVGGDVPQATELDRPRWYPDARWLVVPEGAYSPIGFAARAGHNGEPHNHNDLGSVVVVRGGRMLVADAGRGTYDREYFGPHRYDNPAAGSHGHSVPILDGVVQSEGGSARAEVLHVDLDGGETLEIDLTSAYPHPALTRLVRRVERRGAQVMVTDRLTAVAPIALTQRFVTLVEPDVAGGVLRIAVDGAAAELGHAREATVTTGSFPVGRGSFPMPVHHVDITLPAATEVEHTVVITTAPSSVDSVPATQATGPPG